jgi:putative heme-binding domain-containing protein
MGDEHADAAEQIWYAYCLRVAKVGWTLDQRKQFYGWFDKAAEYKGGHSFVGFIRNIRKESIEGLSASEKQALGDLITKPFESKPLAITPAAGRTFVKMYEMKDLAPLVEGKELTGRNFDRGRAMFSVAACSVCHRIAAEGGTVGPDLTALGTRFSTKDILESIIEPSKVISDQYEQTIFTMEDGSVVVGRIINLGGDSFRVQTNMLDPDSGVGVDRRKIKEMKPSPISPMPPGLLSMLKEDEILDLLAYLKSGGNRDDRMFKK